MLMCGDTAIPVGVLVTASCRYVHTCAVKGFHHISSPFTDHCIVVKEQNLHFHPFLPDSCKMDFVLYVVVHIRICSFIYISLLLPLFHIECPILVQYTIII